MKKIISWCNKNNKMYKIYNDGSFKVRLNKNIIVEFYKNNKSSIKTFVIIKGSCKKEFYCNSQKELLKQFNLLMKNPSYK